VEKWLHFIIFSLEVWNINYRNVEITIQVIYVFVVKFLNFIYESNMKNVSILSETLKLVLLVLLGKRNIRVLFL
jgi:hypothetical protein